MPEAPCPGRNTHVACLLAADPDDLEGSSFDDGEYAMYLDVTAQNLRPGEDANPVITLRARYDAPPVARRAAAPPSG